MVFGVPAPVLCHCPMQGPQAFANTTAPMSLSAGI
jgi:hypothetical protein